VGSTYQKLTATLNQNSKVQRQTDQTNGKSGEQYDNFVVNN